MSSPCTTAQDAHGPTTLDLYAASRHFWLGPAVGASIENYRDLTPPWPRQQVRWRVPATINVEGKRLVQGGPLSWTAEVWRLQPSVLRDVPWSKVVADAEALASALDRALTRGARGMAGAQARLTAEALRRAPTPLDTLRAIRLLDTAKHVVMIDLRSSEPVITGQFSTRGLIAFLVDRDGRVVRDSKSVYVAQNRGEALSAIDLHVVGNVLELSVHPILVAIDGLNSGVAKANEGVLTLRKSAS